MRLPHLLIERVTLLPQRKTLDYGNMLYTTMHTTSKQVSNLCTVNAAEKPHLKFTNQPL